jgi:hypothetical protein
MSMRGKYTSLTQPWATLNHSRASRNALPTMSLRADAQVALRCCGETIEAGARMLFTGQRISNDSSTEASVMNTSPIMNSVSARPSSMSVSWL